MTDPEIAKLLPHQPPMRLIDRVLRHDAGSLDAAVDIHPASAFFQPGAGVPAWVGLEYLGQAAALFFALAGSTPGMTPRPGMLVASRHYDCSVPYFGPGASLRIAVMPASALTGSLVKFRGTISNGVALASGEISVFMEQRT